MRAIFTKPVNSRKLILVEKGFKDCFFPIENGTKQILHEYTISKIWFKVSLFIVHFRNIRSCLPPWEFCLLVSLWGQVQQSLFKLSYSIIVTVPEKIYVICLETETSSIWMNWGYFVGRNFFPILVSLIYNVHAYEHQFWRVFSNTYSSFEKCKVIDSEFSIKINWHISSSMSIGFLNWFINASRNVILLLPLWPNFLVPPFSLQSFSL